MITEATLLEIFYNGILIPAEEESAVFLGFFSPTEAPAGFNAVMRFYTLYIDGIIAQHILSPVQEIELSTMRGFTYQEYMCLYEATLKEKDFSDYTIFRSLLITTDRERKIFIRSHENTYGEYQKVLCRCMKMFNPFLYSFLYEARTYSTSK